MNQGEKRHYVVFPVPTGMNRLSTLMSWPVLCVPRAHGDEPA